MYIDYLTYHEVDVRNTKKLSVEQGNLTEGKLSKLFTQIEKEKITNLEAGNQEEAYSMVVFLEGKNSRIGIVDEEEETGYVYDNLQDDESDIDIAGYDFPQWSVCSDPTILIEILKEFITTGEMLSTVSWREEW